MRASYEFKLATLPPRALSPNARAPWATKARATAWLKEYTALWLQSTAAPSPLPHFTRARITYTMHVSNQWPRHARALEADAMKGLGGGFYRPRDRDNMIASLKPVQDAIVAVGILIDDTADHLELGRPELVRGPYEDEGIHVLIEAIGDSE